MSRILNRVWLLLAGFLSADAFALGLGDIRLESALNEPLRADIVLISATPDELDGLNIQLASSETFERYGIDRPGYLARIDFEIVRSGRTDGNYVRVRSSEPMTEPFLTFLVEANWPRGRLLREYTLLLDPPTFAPTPGGPAQQVVTAPTRSQPADSGEIQRAAPPPAPAPAPAPAPRAEQPRVTPMPAAPAASAADVEPVTFDDTPGGDYRVVRGDTLWGIASRMRPDSRLTMNQTMLAIFEANPEAFAGNINLLSAGATLRMPSADEIFRISRGDALAEVQRQNDAWRGAPPQPSTEQPSLTLVPPDEDTLTGDDSTLYDGTDLTQPDDTGVSSIEEIRIQEIEDLLADQRDGLVSIADNELAALQRELAELRGEELPDDLLADDALEDAAAVDDGLGVDDAALADEDAVFADDLEDPDAVTDEVAPADDVAPDPDIERPAPQVVSTPPQPGMVDRIMGLLTNTWTLIGAALVIVAGVLVWFARRAARGDDEDATGLWETLDADDLEREAAPSTEQLKAMARDEDASIVVVEQETTPVPDASLTSTMEMPSTATLPDDDVLAATGTSPAIEDTFSSETAINLDQSDPIAEADFHMAYGLYDQAADLINGALAVDSDRQDLMAKLCEIYFVWGNRDAFIDAAQRLKNALAGGEDPEWDKIVIMGQQIAADHELFSDVSAAGATKAVDLAFEGGEEQTGALDMDLAAEPTDFGASEVIDLGAETRVSPAASGDASAIDFVFDEEESGGTAITEEMPAADPFEGAFAKTTEMPTVEAPLDGTEEMPTAEVPFDEDTAETPTIETPAADSTAETPTIEQQLAGLEPTGELPSLGDHEVTEIASLEEDAKGPDSTAEIDLDDLGLDLDAMQGSLNDDIADMGEEDLSDLEDTSRREALAMDDDLTITGQSQSLSDLDATGTNEQLVDLPSSTGMHDALDIEEALASTSELMGPADETRSNRALPDEPMEDETDTDIGIDTSLLDATGQTQILPEDFAVDTGTGMAPAVPEGQLPDDAETLLASLDDDEDTETGEFDFAKTEALPKDVFTGDMADDATREMPGVSTPGETDMDLDLDDLTAALQVSAAGDTVNQVRDDATVEQPRPGMSADQEDEPTAAISPDEMSGDLHDARTMTEVGTKLDLARAYVDMGDPGGARSILEEVLDEGDESQRQQARQLLDSLPS